MAKLSWQKPWMWPAPGPEDTELVLLIHGIAGIRWRVSQRVGGYGLGIETIPFGQSYRGGRVCLNSVSVPIDGFPANYLIDCRWWGPTEAMPHSGGEHHAASANVRPQK
jgi:hypothetical protein